MKKFLIMIFTAVVLTSFVATQEVADDAVPGPVPFHGDHRWAYFEGPPVDYETGTQYPRVLEGVLTADINNNCIYNGSEYLTGAAIDIGEPIAGHINMEMSGWHADHEICVGKQTSTPDGGGHQTDTYFGTDWGGEWFNMDDWRLTAHIHQGNEPELDEWREWWVEMPDTDAVPETGAIHTGNPDYSVLTEDAGFAMEDNCHPDTGGCDDLSATAISQKGIDDPGFSGSYWAPFVASERTVNYRNNPHRDDTENLPADNSIDIYHLRATVDYEAGPANTPEDICNPQYLQTPITDELDWKDNSCIDPEHNEWGLAPASNYGIFWNGTPAAPGKCYGVDRHPYEDRTKDQREYANSYLDGALDVVSQGEAGGKLDGNWVDPDDTQRSATRGGISCDLTGWDWGYGYDTGEDSDLNCIQGDCRERGFDVDDPHVITGPIAWENKIEGGNDRAGYGAGDGGAYDPNLPPQYGDACGDDPNEYLIREHNHGDGESSDDVLLNEDDMYGCVTDRSKCIHDGEIYDAGQRKDVAPDERGANSPDYEICVNLDEDIPGGEFADPDNNQVTDRILDTSEDPLDVDSYDYRVTQPGENEMGEAVWHTVENNPEAARTHRSPYGYSRTVAGYPWETDCHPALDRHLKGCDTTMGDEQLLQDYSFYTHFQHGRTLDDFRDEADPGTLNRWEDQDPHQNYHEEIEAYSIRRFVDGSPEDEAYNPQMFQNTEAADYKWASTVDVEFDSSDDFPTENLNNSRIDYYEDNWAAAPNTSIGVGPTGAMYLPGRCYGPNPYELEDQDWVFKDEAVMANSYLTVNESDEYPQKFGDWIDPDDTPESIRQGGFSCDLNTTDWGIGYDKGQGAELEIIEGGGNSFGDVRQQGYDPDNPHAVIGDIQFENKVEWREGDEEGDEDRSNERTRSWEELRDGDEVSIEVGRDEDVDINVEITPHGEDEYFYKHSPFLLDVEVDSEGYVYSASADTVKKISPYGSEVWSFTGHSRLIQAVEVDSEGYVYSASNDDTVKKISPEGNEVWSFTGHTDSVYDVAVDGDGYVYSGAHLGESRDASVRKISPDGNEVWSFEGHTNSVRSIGVDSDGYVYSGSNDDTVRKISPDGDQIWSFELQTDVSATPHGLDVDDNYVYIGTHYENQVMKIDKEGNEIWTFTGHSSTVLDVAVDSDGNVYSAPFDETVRKLDSDGNEVDSFSVDDDRVYGVGVSPVTDSGEQYVAAGTSPDNNLIFRWTTPFDDGNNFVENPSVTVDGQTVEYDGVLEESHSGTFDNIVPGDYTGYIGASDGSFDLEMSWTEISENEDKEFNEDLAPQYGDVCGDDQHEYLIREHNSTDPDYYGDEHDPSLQRDNIYVCATDRNACALNGEVYREGALADVQRADPDGEERGVDSVDEEICVNVDPSVPGGEWVDIDDESINQYLKGEPETYEEDNPDTYRSYVRHYEDYDGDGEKWFTDSFNPAKEVGISPFTDINYSDGYALEDNIGPDVQYTSDEGSIQRYFTYDAVYSHFEDGRPEDDRLNSTVEEAEDVYDIIEGDLFTGVSITTRVGWANGTAHSHWGATNTQDEQNVPDSVDFSMDVPESHEWTVDEYGSEIPVNDSTIDPREKNWAIADSVEKLVGATGELYTEGKCYGQNPWEDDEVDWVTKGDKIMGNNYAYVMNITNDNSSFEPSRTMDKGVWVDPDGTPDSAREGMLSCDLNTSDWGYGYDIGEDEPLECWKGDCRELGYDEDDPHVVVGDIQFENKVDWQEDEEKEYNEELRPQYGDACGDDRYEYLIREHNHGDMNSSDDVLLERDDIYGCATKPNRCIYNGTIYQPGERIDVAPDEQGANSPDYEICVNLDEDIPGGEFADPDNDKVAERILETAEDPLDPETYEYNVTLREEDDKGMAAWHTIDNNPEAHRTYRSPYARNDTVAAYAWGSNCHPDLEGHLSGCDTSQGNEELIQGDAFYTHFQHGRTLDDFRDEADPGTLNRWEDQDPHEDYHDPIEAYSIRRFVNGSPDDEAANAQMFQNTEGPNTVDVDFNSSDDFPTENLNNSRIDYYEDNWAVAPNTSLGVGPTGAMYQPGKCYGPNPWVDEDINYTYKNQSVMANSYLTVNESDEYPQKFGDWIDPDQTEASVREGGFSCDLNATNWGIGYDKGQGAELECLEGDCLAEEWDQDNPHRVVGDISFASDQADRLPGVEADSQYGNVCGDDQNEHLLREYEPRAGPDASEYNHDLDTVVDVFPYRENVYGCGTTPHQCVYNGTIYKEGMTADISAAAVAPEDTEEGVNINDPEVCLDLDPTTPGGSFYDMDNNWMNEEGIKDVGWDGERTWNAIEEHRNDLYFDENLNGTLWQNRTHLMNESQMPQMTPDGWEGGEDMYRPRGYATEAICGPFLREAQPGIGVCDDTGDVDEYSSSPWFNAGNFSFHPDEREGAYQDNYDLDAYWPEEDEHLELVGRHSRVRTNSTQFEPGSDLEENWDLLSTYGPDYSIPDVYTTDPGPNHWALVSNLTMAVGNDGLTYEAGSPTRSGCFYRTEVSDDHFGYQQELNDILEYRNPEPRTHPQEEGLTKMEKVFGNSFAFTEYDETLQTEVGIWVDPDDLPPEYANFTCDITGPDKGYGVDADEFTDPRTDEHFEFDHGEFTWKAGENMDHQDYDDSHVAVGDIAFAEIEGKSGAFSQQPPHCGDDHKEYLIEEVGETTHSLEWQGRWGCGVDTTDCVTRTEETEHALYRSGDYANTQQASENFGRSKDNKAICQQRPDDQHGVWYSQDYSENFCRVNNLYGTEGVRWFDEDYINEYPHSVVGGVNDDMNPYLYEKMDEDDFVTSLQGNASEYEEMADKEGYSPVPTGKYVNRSVDQYYENFKPSEHEGYLNQSVTPGFCGGDDEGENIVVQESSTALVDTDYSIIGVAANPDSCVLDGAEVDGVEHDNRKIYEPGQEEVIDLGPSERTVSCFAGQWFDNWPVTFVQSNMTVEEETEADINFRVINVRNTETTYEVELDADQEIEVFTDFTDIEGDSFTTTLPAESTETHSVTVYGESAEIGPADITLHAESVTGDIEGFDTVTVDVVSQDDAEATSESVSDVPGLGFIHMAVILLLSTLIYYRRMYQRPLK